MGTIISNNTDYKTFTAILDFGGSDYPVNIFVMNNEIGVTSIVSAGTNGQFIVNLSDGWDEQKTFIPSISQFDYLGNHLFTIVWDFTMSMVNQLLFTILDKNGNPISYITANKLAFEIRFYKTQTTL